MSVELPGVERSDVQLFFNYVEVFGVRIYRPDRVFPEDMGNFLEVGSGTAEMSELARQKDVIDVIRDHGGAAYKSSNRFLNGVCDLVVKHPSFPVMHLEAKYATAPARKDTIRLDVTALQHDFLREMHNAGGMAGVISFISREIKPQKAVLVLPMAWIMQRGPRFSEATLDVPLSLYTWGSNWKQQILCAINDYGLGKLLK